MVEHETCAAWSQHQGDQEEKVGWIACLDNVDAALTANLPSQTHCVPERYVVLTEITERSTGRGTQRVPQDTYALDDCLGFAIVLGAPRTDNRDLEARFDQCAALLSGPAVSRHGQVLDEDQYVASHIRPNRPILRVPLFHNPFPLPHLSAPRGLGRGRHTASGLCVGWPPPARL